MIDKLINDFINEMTGLYPEISFVHDNSFDEAIIINYSTKNKTQEFKIALAKAVKTHFWNNGIYYVSASYSHLLDLKIQIADLRKELDIITQKKSDDIRLVVDNSTLDNISWTIRNSNNVSTISKGNNRGMSIAA